MYLEIDEGYFEHPKTLDLCSRLQDSKACVYPLRLWKWACRSAKSGKLGKISYFAMEKAVDYEPMDGKCFDAMRESGFVDRHDDGTFEIHDWMSYTGGALKRMEDKAAENRRRREEGKRRYEAEQERQRTGIVPVQSENRTGTNPTQTRQVKTRPDKTSPDPENTDCAETPEASSPPAVPPLLTFPCDGSPNQWHLTQPQVDRWNGLFPSLDIMAECRSALAWVEANPSKRKTAGGMPKTLVGWFTRSQNRGAQSANGNLFQQPQRAQAKY